jgi:hypothetical protein
MDTTSGSLTVTLPAAPENGTPLCVKMVTQGYTSGVPNTVTIAAAGSDVFEKPGGVTSVTLKLSGQGKVLQYISGIWTTTSDDLPLGQLDNRYQSVFSVLSYGADPTGVADSTTAIQAAINAATGSANPVTTIRTPISPVYIPAGIYKITSDLVIRSVEAFHLIGAGQDIVQIKPSGTNFVQAALFINGSADSLFEGFLIQGDGTESLIDAIRLDWVTPTARSDTLCVTNSTVTVANTKCNGYDVGGTVTGTGIPASTTVVSVIPGVSWTLSNAATASGTVTLSIATLYAAARSTTGNRFRDVRVKSTNFVTGISLEGNGSVQVDGTVFDNVVVSGSQAQGTWSNTTYWQNGFALGNGSFGNNYDHEAFGCDASACINGWKVNASSVGLFGSQPAGNFTDFNIVPGAQCTFENIQSQNCNRFISTINAFSPIPVSFRDCLIKTTYANASGILANIFGGVWHFDNISAVPWQIAGSGVYSGAIFSISGSAANRPSTVTFDSIVCGNTKVACIVPTGTFPVTINSRNFVNYSSTTGNSAAPVAGDISSFWSGTGSGGAWTNTDSGSVVIAPQVNFFTANGTWNKPAGAVTVHVTVLGGGSGGGAGASGTSGTVQCGGGGGAGGVLLSREFVASDLPSTVPITIGGGGNGGASVTGSSGNTSGTAGSSGVQTSFGSYLTGQLGYPGSGGTTTSGTGAVSIYGVGGGNTGGGGSASATGGAGAQQNQNALPGGVGGAPGGGITTGAVAGAGAAGTKPLIANDAIGGSGGVVGGASPTSGTASALANGSVGPSAGAGAASTTGAAQAGANALANSGAGGSGGGASLNGSASGAGGNGGSGWVLAITYFQ